MKNITVPIKVPRYLWQYVRRNFGEFAAFPRGSFVNYILHRLLTKRPPNAEPRRAPSAPILHIVIPDCRFKKPEYYNYLTPRAEIKIRKALFETFDLDMWRSLQRLIRQGMRIEHAVHHWCEQVGLDIAGREAVRKRFYRMRKRG